jgi:hypothetical protein
MLPPDIQPFPHHTESLTSEVAMDGKDLFLAQHAAVHSAAVGGNKMSAAERTFGGLTEDQMRVRPREDLNSIAWLMWHIARAEDIFVNPVLGGRDQVFDDAWMRRLGIDRKDFGIGMTSAEVTDLTRKIDVAALREYRDAVGLRTREIVGGFKDADWAGEIPAGPLERAAAQGAFAPGVVKAFTGRPRVAVLSGLALFHPSGHMGEAVTVRSAGGFGTGI